MKAEIFPGSDGQWYWRMKSSNGRILACGGEGFVTVHNCRESLQNVVRRLGANGMPKYRIIPKETPADAPSE